MNKIWLDMSMYGLRLFVARGADPSKTFLAVTGKGINDHSETLEQLGFLHDDRPQFNKPGGNRYWVCPTNSITLGSIHATYPRAEIKELPVDVIFPSLLPKISPISSIAENGKRVVDKNSATLPKSGTVGFDNAAARLFKLEEIITQQLSAGFEIHDFMESFLESSGSERRSTPYYQGGRVDIHLFFEDLISAGYQVNGQPDFELLWNKVSNNVKPQFTEDTAENAAVVRAKEVSEDEKGAPQAKWFGSQEKAEAFVKKKSLAGTHQVVFDGRSRWEIRLLTTSDTTIAATTTIEKLAEFADLLVVETISSGQHSARTLFSKIIKSNKLSPPDQLAVREKFQTKLKVALAEQASSILDFEDVPQRNLWEIPVDQFLSNPESNPYFATRYSDEDQRSYVDDARAYHRAGVLEALAGGARVPFEVGNPYAGSVVIANTETILLNVLFAGIRAKVAGPGDEAKVVWVVESSKGFEAFETNDYEPETVFQTAQNLSSQQKSRLEFITSVIEERGYLAPHNTTQAESGDIAAVSTEEPVSESNFIFTDHNEWPDQRIDHFKAVLSEIITPEQIPRGWIVMNCTRPLVGHVVLQDGPYLSGRFYAGIDPTDAMADTFIQKNYDLDASVVLIASLETQMQLALIDNKHKERYLRLELPERLDALTPVINTFKGKQAGKLKGLIQSTLPVKAQIATVLPTQAEPQPISEPVMSAAHAETDEDKVATTFQNSQFVGEQNDDADSTRSTAGSNRGRPDASRVTTDGLLGGNMSRNDAANLPKPSGSVEQVGNTGELSSESAANFEGGSAPADKGLEAEQSTPDKPEHGLHGPGSLGKLIEAARTRGSARRNEQELQAASSRDLDSTAVAPTAIDGWTGLTNDDLSYTTGQYSVTAAHVQLAFKALLRHESGEQLTSSERSTLAAFRGWGGVSGALRTDNKKDYENRLGRETAAILGMKPESFNQLVLANRLESYYTPGNYASAVWKAMEQLGVLPTSRVLDAGCGSAIFFASAPAEFQRHATLVGVECDPIAVRLAKAIAPQAKIIEKKFESVVFSKDTFDCVVGNVPFGETRVFDRDLGESLHIHDYFILKSLKHLKPGGVMSVITSAGTMDKADPAIRQMLLGQANLVAAFRLPVQAFGDQKASVTTDLLILQKRPMGTVPDFDFTSTEQVEMSTPDGSTTRRIGINRYFVENPQNVLGRSVLTASNFGPKYSVQLDMPALLTELGLPVNSRNEFDQSQKHSAIASSLLSRISELPKDLVSRNDWVRDHSLTLSSPGSEQLSESAFTIPSYGGLVGDYTMHEGDLIEVIDISPVFDDEGVQVSQAYIVQPMSYLKPGERSLILDYVPLRDATRLLVLSQIEGDDDRLHSEQVTVKKLYDHFVEKYGPVNSDRVSRVIADDSGSSEVAALEVWDEKEGMVVQLADIFTKRVVNPEQAQRIVDDASDALALSIDRKGRIDFEFMQEVSNFTYDELVRDLVGSAIFKNPETDSFELRNQYLSGNVIKKLRIAEQLAALEPEYVANVAELKEAQPAKIPFEEITIRLGAGWIPTDDVRVFTCNLFGRSDIGETDFRVRHIPSASLWSVEVSNAFKRNNERARTMLYGHSAASYETLLEKLLNGSRPTHKKEVDGRSIVDEEATLLSSEVQKRINDEFNKWVASDKQRIIQYTDLYNEANNIFVVPKADGSKLTFPGLSPTWHPMAHQSGAVAMAIMGYNFLAAHPVGAGKTFEEIAIAMKLKQLGIVTKPAVAVPNHMLGQIAREAKHMFPAARILMITQEDLKGKSRKRFLSVARNNDWDIVIMTHSMLNQISAPRRIIENSFISRLAQIDTVISNCDSPRLERQLIAKRKTQENKLENLRQTLDSDERVGARVYIDELGIDFLNVDEWHLYKNLELNSGMNVLGVTNSGSQRASNLEQIGLYLQEHWKKPFGLNGFTGTVLSNTMCELYVHAKMLRPDLLEEMDIFSFDDWASRFGEVVTSLEALPEGGGYKVSERFARFVNLPEMLSLFRSFADVRSKEELNLPTPEVVTEVISVPPTEWQQAYMKHLANRAIAVRNMQVHPSQDNLLKISTDGRKASLDMRLCAPDLPPNSSMKLATAAAKIHALWAEHAENKATQLVFLDLGTPGKHKEFVAYEAIADELYALGVPEREVEFIHNFKTVEAKEDAFDRFRAGKLRVLLGSTEKMGVGTNVQERLVAIHHIDTGWNPAATAQRRGRVERRGNKFFDRVFEFRYTTIDSFDLFMWETNKRKANFINQALADPKQAGREVSEEMDLGYAEVLAVTTGNPLIREKVLIDDKVTKLQRQQRVWSAEISRIEDAMRSSERQLAWDKRQHCDLVAAGNLIPDSTYKPVVVEGTISGLQEGDTSWLTAKEVGTAILSRLAFLESRLMRSMEPSAPLKVSVGEIELHLKLVRSVGTGIQLSIVPMVGGEEFGTAQRLFKFSISKDPKSVGRSIRALYEMKGYLLGRAEDNLSRSQAEVNRLNASGLSTSSTWPYAVELVEAISRQAELNRHFASQVSSMESIDDPYTEMLQEYRSQLDAVDTSDNPFETVALHSDLGDLGQGLLFENDDVRELTNKYSQSESNSSADRYQRMNLR